ncbi:MAG: flavodoxin domain-containing protein [candidate division WOR-3 bacterium]
MNRIEIAPDIFWVGAVDWHVREFHGHTYTTHRGSSYNAYLIRDEKTALVDTVYGPFTNEMLDRIRAILPIEKIDYVISNHVETDHSGGLAGLMKLIPDRPVYCTARGKEGLHKYYQENWDFRVVKSGDTLKLGRRTLTFLEAPMLHWPDSMFTYLVEDGILMPNDAFGQHYATSARFADEVDQYALFEEAAKYYANILYPLSSLVVKKIEEVAKMNLRLNMIAPSHGLIWRKEPMQIVTKWLSWAKGEATDEVVVAFDTMWGATEEMAHLVAEGLAHEGVGYRLFKMSVTDRSDVFKEILYRRGLLVGSSTINQDILPTMAPFLEDLKGLRPVKKLGAAFGAYGWSGGAVASIEATLKKATVDVVLPGLSLKWRPDASERQKCIEFGQEFARRLKQR